MFIDRAYAFRFDGKVFGNYIRLDPSGPSEVGACELGPTDDDLEETNLARMMKMADEVLRAKAGLSLVALGAPADTPVVLFTRDVRHLLEQAEEVLDA